MHTLYELTIHAPNKRILKELENLVQQTHYSSKHIKQIRPKPIERRRFSLIRSPHVHRKSQEQYYLQEHGRVWKIMMNPKEFQDFLLFLSRIDLHFQYSWKEFSSSFLTFSIFLSL